MGLFGSSKKSSGIFVPHGNGFRELTDTIENKSINGIAEYLGYNTNEFHTFIGNWNATNEIQTIVTKIFTTEILFLITLDSITEMPKSAVDQFMMNFNFNNEYDSLNVKAMLTEGIENKSLKLEYLAQVLGFDPQELDGGGIIFSEKLNLYLYFSNGLLVDFSSGDGFNEGARFFQSLNPGLFEDYVSAAEHVWGEDTQSVKRMLNIQSECMTKTQKDSTTASLKNIVDTWALLTFACYLYVIINIQSELKNFNSSRKASRLKWQQWVTHVFGTTTF